jgi:DNA-binding transcriptional regulator YiaG
MYNYVGCGLRNVWLVNGFEIRETPYGESVAIENVLGLHRAIGEWLINSSGRLSGPEFRFLRKEQELSQRSLGDVLGADEQSVARWEKGRQRVPKWADHFVRGLYNQYINGDGTLKELIDRINSLEERRHEGLKFSLNHSHWSAETVREVA